MYDTYGTCVATSNSLGCSYILLSGMCLVPSHASFKKMPKRACLLETTQCRSVGGWGPATTSSPSPDTVRYNS